MTNIIVLWCVSVLSLSKQIKIKVMETKRDDFKLRRLLVLKFMTKIKGRPFTSLKKASLDAGFTYGIAKRLDNEELIHLTDQIEKRMRG